MFDRSDGSKWLIGCGSVGLVELMRWVWVDEDRLKCESRKLLTHKTVLRLNNFNLNIAFSPIHISYPVNTKGSTALKTIQAITLPSLHFLVTPPHCMNRIKQHAQPIEIAHPPQSHMIT